MNNVSSLLFVEFSLQLVTAKGILQAHETTNRENESVPRLLVLIKKKIDYNNRL